jgi:hypothetical protein
MTLYSFKDLAGVISFPLSGNFILGGGEIGLGQITVDMTTDRTVVDKSSDGSIMMSYVAGDNGTFSIECQQTSDLHVYLLRTFNLAKTAADLGNVAAWAGGAANVRNILDGSQHSLSGVAMSKIPPKVYQEVGQKITWMMHAARIINE